jgi:hypothetical protein
LSKVFKGLWRGTTVAVKTMILPANMSGAEKREKMVRHTPQRGRPHFCLCPGAAAAAAGATVADVAAAAADRAGDAAAGAAIPPPAAAA